MTSAITPGEEQVLRALDICRRAAEAMTTLGGPDEAWRSGTAERLTRLQGTLDQVKDRFIIKSKVCLPFTARCAERAAALEASLQALGADGSAGATDAFAGDLDALEKAVRTLDGRSDMRGMAIT